MIRALTPEDAEAYYALRLHALQTDPEAFAVTAEEFEDTPMTETEAYLRSVCSSPDQTILGAFLEGELVGMIGFRRKNLAKTRHKGRIWGVFVAPKARRRGIAGMLLDELLRWAHSLNDLQQIQLHVVTGLLAPLKLYESRGFRAYGLEKDALFVNGRGVDQNADGAVSLKIERELEKRIELEKRSSHPTTQGFLLSFKRVFKNRSYLAISIGFGRG